MQINHLKKSASDKAFYVLNSTLLIFALLIVLIPLLHVMTQSISMSREVIAGRVFIIPKKITFMAYQEIFRSKLLISGYLQEHRPSCSISTAFRQAYEAPVQHRWR